MVNSSLNRGLVINEPGPSAEETVIKPPVNFLFFGDTMIDRSAGIQIKKNGFDYLLAKLAGEGKWFFQGWDFVGSNLEGAVTDNGAHYPPNMGYDFAFDPALVGKFKDYNFNFFALANNHLTDQGIKGVEETRKNLDLLGISYAGCPDAMVDSCSSLIKEVGDLKVGLAAFSMVYHNFDLAKAEAVIQDLKQKSDLVIVNIHWGNEYQHQFNKYQEAIGHALIDAGADVIIGHHPHVVQGLEIYQGKPIFYSLGNFVFDQYFSPDTQESLAVGLNVTPDKFIFSLFPLQAQKSQVELKSEESQIKFFERFIGWSSVDQEIFEDLRGGIFELER